MTNIEIEDQHPDFGGIAERLEHLGTLESRGWWADWGGCMYAENLIRCFGPLVAEAAADCEFGLNGCTETTTVSVLNMVDVYLDWQHLVASGDDEKAKRLIDAARAALDALKSHLEGPSDLLMMQAHGAMH